MVSLNDDPVKKYRDIYYAKYYRRGGWPLPSSTKIDHYFRMGLLKVSGYLNPYNGCTRSSYTLYILTYYKKLVNTS